MGTPITVNMKAFICLFAAASAVAHNTGVPHAHPHALGHSAYAPVVAAGYHARPAGQVSHQSVSRPYQGEHRSTTQSKAFGASVAAVADSANRLHGAHSVLAHGPAYHAAPVYHAPVVHAAPVYHAPIVHAAPAYHAPIVHAALAYHAEPAYPNEPSPYTYTYAV